MTHQTLTLAGAGGLQLFAQRWLPSGTPRAKLAIVHGYAEHSGRYRHVAEFFTRQGLAVYAYDQRGHGRSPGKKAYVERFELLLKDLTAFLDWVRADGEKLPVFLFGHSMGGAVVTLYCVSRKPPLRGVILSGAALKVSEDIGALLQKFSSVLSSLVPRVPILRLDPELISRDPEVVRAYREDPLVYSGRVYARTGAEILEATRRAERQLRAFDHPVLIMQGTDDGLVEPEGSHMLYQQAASPDKTLKRYEGAFHELVNELNKEEVMNDMRQWMNERLDTAPQPEQSNP